VYKPIASVRYCVQRIPVCDKNMQNSPWIDEEACGLL